MPFINWADDLISKYQVDHEDEKPEEKSPSVPSTPEKSPVPETEQGGASGSKRGPAKTALKKHPTLERELSTVQINISSILRNSI